MFYRCSLVCVYLQNQSRWKTMSEEALKSVCAPGSTTSLPPLPPLCAPSLDPAASSNQLELEMRYLVSEHRKVKPASTVIYTFSMIIVVPYSVFPLTPVVLWPPGSGSGDSLGRPPVLPAVLRLIGL